MRKNTVKGKRERERKRARERKREKMESYNGFLPLCEKGREKKSKREI